MVISDAPSWLAVLLGSMVLEDALGHGVLPCSAVTYVFVGGATFVAVLVDSCPHVGFVCQP